MKPTRSVTIIGGGTGTFVVTRGLKQLDRYDLTKIVAVFDSGGATARLRDEFGFLPVGDLRQSLAAIAQENHQTWIRDLLLYRFSKGDGLAGHNLGNLILTALQDMTGSTPEALKVATKIFRLTGTVIPVTTGNVDLKITYTDGTVLIGEHTLDEVENGGRPIRSVTLTQPCALYSQAKAAITNSDYIIIGPGDLYASLVPNFVVRGFKPALKQSRAKLIYIVNLMTRYTQTHGFSVSDHVRTIESYLGKPLDYVIINTGKIRPAIEKKYAEFKEFPVADDLPSSYPGKVIRGDFASSVAVKPNPADPLPRALMRHDQAKLLHALEQIMR